MARAPRVFAPGLLCYAIVRAIIKRNDCQGPVAASQTIRPSSSEVGTDEG